MKSTTLSQERMFELMAFVDAELDEVSMRRIVLECEEDEASRDFVASLPKDETKSRIKRFH